MDPLNLEDLLLIAEAFSGVPAEEVRHAMKIGAAESALAAPFAEFGGTEFYPDPASKIAVLGSRLVRNHPLPDGNKRLAWLSMREFAARNDILWCRIAGAGETAEVIEDLAAGTLSEDDFTTWVAVQLRFPPRTTRPPGAPPRARSR